MKLCLAFLVVLFFMPTQEMKVFAAGTSYYVDAELGDDANNGTSTKTPWKSLEKVNSSTFQPGDQILFKTGSIFSGQLKLTSSGSSENPIIVSSYGTGNKPIINGDGVLSGAVELYNVQYIEVSNLEVTNNASNQGDRAGIMIQNVDQGTLNHIYISNCYVHDVKGSFGGGQSNFKANGGIITKITGSTTPSNWNDLQITNNQISNVVRQGIYMHTVWSNRYNISEGIGDLYMSTNVVISNNRLDTTGGDGIVIIACDGAMTEYNVVRNANSADTKYGHAGIWWWNSDNSTIQYCEVYETKRGKYDGMAYDFDNSINNNLYQYNYSHENDGGFLNLCADGLAANCVARYNISQNDGPVRVFLITKSKNNKDIQIYNNTVYISAALNSPIISNNASPTNLQIKNNIFYNLGTGTYGSNTSGITWDSNIYYGNNQPQGDDNAITTDPKLAAPGTGGIGRDSVEGYKLLADSPAIGSGALIGGNGTQITTNGGKDYWGNKVSDSQVPNRGAYNGNPVDNAVIAPRNYVQNGGFETGEINPWSVQAGCGIVEGNQNSGAYSLEEKGNKKSAEQVISGLTPNTTYILSGYAKVSGLDDSVRLGVKGFGGEEVNVSITSNEYTQGTLTFTTGDTNIMATIYAWKDAGKGSAYIDEMTVTKAPISAGSEFSLTVRKSGKVIGVVNDSTENGAKLEQSSDSGSESQRWTIVEVEDGYYKLVNGKSNKVMDVQQNSLEKGASIIQSEDTGADSQQWMIYDVGNGCYKIVSKLSKLALNVDAGSTANGASIIQWYYMGGTNEQILLNQVN